VSVTSRYRTKFRWDRDSGFSPYDSVVSSFLTKFRAAGRGDSSRTIVSKRLRNRYFTANLYSVRTVADRHRLAAYHLQNTSVTEKAPGPITIVNVASTRTGSEWNSLNKWGSQQCPVSIKRTAHIAGRHSAVRSDVTRQTWLEAPAKKASRCRVIGITRKRSLRTGRAVPGQRGKALPAIQLARKLRTPDSLSGWARVEILAKSRAKAGLTGRVCSGKAPYPGQRLIRKNPAG